jgi:hypothetical protein
MENINDALIECVKAVGGSKQAGALLWPEKTSDAAQRQLLDCLNPDRPAHLTPEQVVYLFRLAKEKGYHDALGFVLTALGYAPTNPIEPKDEAADLMRKVIEGQAVLTTLMARLNIVREQIK